MTATLPDAQATEALGAALAAGLEPGAVIHLSGPLGAGKTTLVRGLLRALGHGETVRSPTFTLVEPYAAGGLTLYHVDLYRVADPEEVEMLGLRDWLGEGAVLLVEWPERAAGVLPPADLRVTLEHAGERRRARLAGEGARGRRLAAVAKRSLKQ